MKILDYILSNLTYIINFLKNIFRNQEKEDINYEKFDSMKSFQNLDYSERLSEEEKEKMRNKRCKRFKDNDMTKMKKRQIRQIQQEKLNKKNDKRSDQMMKDWLS